MKAFGIHFVLLVYKCVKRRQDVYCAGLGGSWVGISGVISKVYYI